jgi:microcystin-dependent protein
MSSYQQLNVAPNPANANTGAYFLPGMISLWGGSTAPADWLLCNGALVSRTAYANLFAAIGTTFGVGDGTTTFALPSTNGRTVRGVGTSSQWTGNGSGTTGSTTVTLGSSGGGDGTKVSADNLPAHRHGITSFVLSGSTGAGGGALGVSPGQYYTASAQTYTDATTPTAVTNSNAPVTNAYVGINYIIKV